MSQRFSHPWHLWHLGIVLLAATSFFSGALAAENVSCDELNRYWGHKFHSDFNVLWPNVEFQCPSETSQIAKAFYDVLKAPAAHDYYSWMLKMIRSVRFEPKPDLFGYNSNNGDITICKVFTTTDDEARAGTLVHEASHSRPEDPSHVTCTHGAKKGSEGSCDEKLYERFAGSGYNFEFVWNNEVIAKGTYNYLSMAVLKGWNRYMVLNRFNRVTLEQVKRYAPFGSSDSSGVRTLPRPRRIE